MAAAAASVLGVLPAAMAQTDEPPAAPQPSEPPVVAPQPAPAQPAGAAPNGVPQAPPNPSAADAAAWQQYAAWQAYQQQAYQQQLALEREPERRWYGWQTLLTDGASLSLMIAGSAANSGSSDSETGSAFATAGFLSYLFATPIVHAAHGHWGKAGGSFAIRAGSTVLLVLGVAQCLSETLFTDRSCSGSGTTLLVLGTIGFFGAIVVDAAVIAREDVPSGDEARLKLAPWVDARTGAGGLTLRGGF